ncbi:MAG: glycerol kinase GlpK [Pseudomonadota bacterium]
MPNFILAIDQGTTSSRSILFDENRKIVAVAQKEFTQHFPNSGWVEHDPEEIWESVLETVHKVLEKAQCTASDILAIGITNQRETTIVWDKSSGKPVYNAIVWQDRRTAEFCNKLKGRDLEPVFSKKTGLLLDPYFSGTKIGWILDNVDGARLRAEKGELLFGTVDSFLVWRLTGGKTHATDSTNASRTLVYDIANENWDDELLEILNVPKAVLPEVRECSASYGETIPELFGSAIPIMGVAGDQQAAAIGQACFAPGMIKSTYGTGCFALLNTGPEIIHSSNRLLTTIAYKLDGETHYALEGSIFIAGAAVQWLRDGLRIMDSADQSGSMAKVADENQNVYMVPAFTGLGAPYWDADARGALFGLTRATGPNELSKAALESVCYQTRDLLEAMKRDWEGFSETTTLRVDGGMVASDWTMQFLADILDAPVERPEILETTALGAAWLAASKCGFWPSRKDMELAWAAETRFGPEISEAARKTKYDGWLDCVKRTMSN